VKLTVDNRELRSEVVKELYNQGVELETRNLEIGDYLTGDIIIERKTIPDFVNSLIDGRLFEQAVNMKKYEKQLIILEGEESIYNVRNMHPNAIRGAMTKLLLNMKIPIIQTFSPTDTALYIITILKQQPKDLPDLLKTRKSLTNKEMKEIILTTLPGVGRKTAQKILQQEKTIKKFINLQEEEMKKIKGLGTLSERIHKIINEDY